MKFKIVTILFLICQWSPFSRAVIIECVMSEPILRVNYQTETGKLTYESEEIGNLVEHQDLFLRMAKKRLSIVDANQKIILDLQEDGKSHFGESDEVAPYTGTINIDGIKAVGGCGFYR